MALWVTDRQAKGARLPNYSFGLIRTKKRVHTVKSISHSNKNQTFSHKIFHCAMVVFEWHTGKPKEAAVETMQLRRLIKSSNESLGPYLFGEFEFLNLNPISTGLCHVITVYGLIQPSAGMNRVKDPRAEISSPKFNFQPTRTNNYQFNLS